MGRYQRALAESGWKGTSFRMVNERNQTQYHLIYGTEHPRGRRAFKDAAWYVAPDGTFQYSDLSDPRQLALPLKEMTEDAVTNDLCNSMLDKYRGQLVPKAHLLEFTDDHPVALSRHLTAALNQLEASEPSGIQAVIRPGGERRKRGTFPPDCEVQFAS